MKILAIAHVPPPLHGQSVMVQTMLDDLPAQGIAVYHVPLVLSRNAADFGRWRPGKVIATIRAGFAARRLARQETPDVLYYVPAPGKRGALYRDIVLMKICRSACPKLVLHWHAPGLGTWLASRAYPIEGNLAHQALGGADLSLVLAPELAADAAFLGPRSTVVVANGLPDPGALPPRPPREGRPGEILFLGQGSAPKGLFTAIEALKILHARRPGSFRLTFAGEFPSADDKRRFNRIRAAVGSDTLRHVGFVHAVAKRRLFAQSDIMCYPTSYPHEGQPLVLLEAMAQDLPIVSTRWRAIPSTLPSTHTRLVEPSSPAATAEAIVSVYAERPPNGALRQHFLSRFTRAHHVAALAKALHGIR